MRKYIALLMVLVLSITMFAGCGGGNDAPSANNNTPAENSDTSGSDSSSYGIDLASTEVQQMSEERATKEKLGEAVAEWLEGNTMFPEGTEMGKRTYQDFVDFIGCDATQYSFDDSHEARSYTWIAEEADNSKLTAWFTERGGSWNLSFTGSANLI